jgi:hypothetical protein
MGHLLFRQATKYRSSTIRPWRGSIVEQPDYPSAHAVQGGAAAAVLARVFGTDDITFPACSMSLAAGSTCTGGSPVLHWFSSFSEAANENGVSRILIGIHFRGAVEEGIRHGRRIGDRAVTRFLRPVY